MGRQLGRNINYSFPGVGKYNAAGMEMQLLGNAFRHVGVAAIFLVSQYGVPI